MNDTQEDDTGLDPQGLIIEKPVQIGFESATTLTALPKTIEINGIVYPITRYTQQERPLEEMQIIIGGGGLLETMVKWLTQKKLVSLAAFHEENKALGDYVELPADQRILRESLEEETEGEIQILKERWYASRVPVLINTITIAENQDTETRIISYTIGQRYREQEQWRVPLETARALLLLRQTFGASLKRQDEVRIYTIYDFHETTNSRYQHQGFTSESMKCFGIHFPKSGDTILTPPASVIENPHDQLQRWAIKEKHIQIIIQHELAHKVDPFLGKLGSIVHWEGFAVMCQNQFRYEEIMDSLRTHRGYGRTITRNHLFSLLSKQDQSIRSKPEIYDVSGAFFAYVFQRLGCENFFQFYEDLVKNGAVLKAVKIAGKNIIDFRATTFVDEFIKEMNKNASLS